MKLYPIIYTNEAAKTPTEAIESDLGLIIVDDPDYVSAILISTKRCETIAKTYERLKAKLPKQQDKAQQPTLPATSVLSTEPYNSSLPPWELNEAAGNLAKLAWLEKAIGNRAVVGNVGANHSDTNMWRVNHSVAFAKYGPMLYEILLGLIYPSYLCSDYSLTKDSRKVWNVMYTRNDVEAIPVSEISDDSWSALRTSFNVAGMESEAAKQAKEKLDEESYVPEDWTETFVASLPPEDKAKLGPFFAYRKKSGSNLSKYNNLLDAGEDVVNMFASTLNLAANSVKETISIAAGITFSRVYNKGQ